MPVLIDGNNLLHAAHEADPEHPIARSRLVQVLGEWSRRFGERIAIVFDGAAPAGGFAEQFAGGSGISVAFSGSGVSADGVVIDALAKDSSPRRLVVVSSDREIARAAKRRRATPVRSADFWQIVQDDLARPPAQRLEPLEKRFGQSREATGEWLRELGL